MEFAPPFKAHFCFCFKKQQRARSFIVYDTSSPFATIHCHWKMTSIQEMPVAGTTVLLPANTLPAPHDGILYAEIIQPILMTATNPYNVSQRKGKPGWEVITLTDPPHTIRVPKAQIITSVSSEVLATELDDRPHEKMGLYVTCPLSDDDGKSYINYGQIVHYEWDEETFEYIYIVKFRPLANGGLLNDKTYSDDDIISSEVPIQHYVLGLGMGVPFDDPHKEALRFSDLVTQFPKKSSLTSWTRTFKSVNLPTTTIVVLDQYLKSTELDVERILIGYTGIGNDVSASQEPLNLASVQPVDRALNNAFDQFSIGGSEKGNEQSSVFPPNNTETPDHPITTSIPTMDTRNEQRRVNRETNITASYALTPPASAQATAPSTNFIQAFDTASLKNQLLTNSMAYRLTESQFHRHSVTFKEGVYGKSRTQKEASEGIERVFESEMEFAVNPEEGQVRSMCIMSGNLHNSSFPAWRNIDFDAFAFSDSWAQTKWSKTPILDLPDVDNLDLFWRLWIEMELAATRYYQDSYCDVMRQIKRNLTSGFTQFGGRDQFEALSHPNRVSVIHCAIKYYRAVLQKFLTQILIPGSKRSVVEWLSHEGVQDHLFYSHVTQRLQAIQFRELRASKPSFVKHQPSPSPTPPSKNPPGGDRGKNKLTVAMRAMIPKGPNGIGMCIMSFTNRGCKKADCPWVERFEGGPGLNTQLQDWLKEVQGSYRAP